MGGENLLCWLGWLVMCDGTVSVFLKYVLDTVQSILDVERTSPEENLPMASMKVVLDSHLVNLSSVIV